MKKIILAAIAVITMTTAAAAADARMFVCKNVAVTYRYLLFDNHLADLQWLEDGDIMESMPGQWKKTSKGIKILMRVAGNNGPALVHDGTIKVINKQYIWNNADSPTQTKLCKLKILK